jgi:hypothetical protein
MKKEHSINIGIIRLEDELFLKITVKGKLTHKDYQMMIPMIENALIGVKDPKIKLLVDAREFEGWDLHAALDDLKFGLKHNKEFTKLAFVGNKMWEEYSIKISNWFTSADMRYFQDLQEALTWLNKKEENIKDMDNIEKEFLSREEEIKKELRFLFKANMKITGWDVPEADNQKAAKILVNILQKSLDEIKADIKNGKFK